MATEPVKNNAAQLVTVRVAGMVQGAAANVVVDREAKAQVLPGQGGVVIAPTLGDRAGGWMSDHLEPGASIIHPDPAANRALQVLACVGNPAFVVDGPAAGAQGMVSGKHGATLVAFPDDALRRLAPGDRVAIDAVGVGLRIEGEPQVTIHSCDPSLLSVLIRGRDDSGRLRVATQTILPAEAAGAGIGMPVDHLNLDLQVDELPSSMAAGALRLGDVCTLEDHDHRFGRQVRPGWMAIGAISHGQSAGGGHGLGFVTLLTAPRDRLALEVTPQANLVQLVSAESGQ